MAIGITIYFLYGRKRALIADRTFVAADRT
jgi:hypothetical protein